MRTAAVSVIIIAAVAVLVVFSVPQELYMRVRAAQIRTKLEEYRTAHGIYPISLTDIPGTPLNGPIYYERSFETPEVYYLWFGTGVGTVSQYDSKTRTWHGPQ